MKPLGKWLLILGLIAACGVAAWFLAPRLEVDFKVALLISMAVANLLISAYLEWIRHHLRNHVERMAAEDRASLSRSEPEIRYAIPARGSVSPSMTTWIGAIAVNGPLIPLMIGPLALLQHVFDIHDPLASSLCLALGFVVAWAWWSVGVTVWRWWATSRRGMSPGEAQWRGEGALILWPKGHFFEKTELGNMISRRSAP